VSPAHKTAAQGTSPPGDSTPDKLLPYLGGVRRPGARGVPREKEGEEALRTRVFSEFTFLAREKSFVSLDTQNKKYDKHSEDSVTFLTYTHSLGDEAAR
jgi:hypothetical protein